MNPVITEINNNQGLLEFRLSGVNVSVANALRRTLLTDIPRIVLNQVKIETNTSAHFHNEIMKHRIQCVPLIPMKNNRIMTDEEMQEFIENHQIEVHVVNDTSDMVLVTTEHFKIFNRTTQQFLSKEETREKFPAYKTHYFIDLMRLAPSRGLQIPGEQFKAVIEMTITTAQEDGCFTVLSTCSFQNTRDLVAIDRMWAQYEKSERKQYEESGMEGIGELMEFKKRDFYLLDAQKYFVENSFDFLLESNGIYTNEDIVFRACQIMKERAKELLQQVRENKLEQVDSRTQVKRGGAEYSTMKNAIDILLPETDYTMGYLLDALLYTMFFEGERKLSYCGFTKYHPHLTESVLRLAFHEEAEIPLWPAMMLKAIEKIDRMFVAIQTPFAKKTTAPLEKLK